jgi:hypothetical protein
MNKAGIRRLVGDHFEPDEASDPKAQRLLRGHLEQIDYIAYDANRKVISAALGGFDATRFERLGLAISQARARWLAAGLAAGETGHLPSPEQIAKIAQLRGAYEELAEVYEGMRRAVERGYLTLGAG